MRTLTVGSLFAGIGGFDLGFERAGFEIKWQVEIDEYCRKLLGRHWPNVAKFGDIHACGAHNLEAVDVVCGGFPCQPVSGAGLKRAQEDDRWLWPEFFRIVCELRPRYVVVENVAGLRRRGMGDVLGDLAAIRYDAEWQSIPAAAVGAPHIRDRVWILAYPERDSQQQVQGGRGDSERQRIDVFPKGDGGEPSEWREDRQLIGLVPGIHPGVVADWWRAQSRMARSVNGLPDQMDRVNGLGNAVVPQITEWIAHRIKDAEAVNP